MKRPEPPEMPEKRRASWLSIALAVLFGSALAALLTILTLGYFGPVILLAGIVFFVIGLQYLLWGWFFERIYRQGRPDDDEPTP